MGLVVGVSRRVDDGRVDEDGAWGTICARGGGAMAECSCTRSDPTVGIVVRTAKWLRAGAICSGLEARESVAYCRGQVEELSAAKKMRDVRDLETPALAAQGRRRF